MKNQRLYEGLTVSICVILSGLESIGFPAWYFIRSSHNPYQVYKATFFFNLPVKIIFFAIVWIANREFYKKRVALGITLPETRSFIEYLRASKTWILIVLVVIVMPIVFTLDIVLRPPYVSVSPLRFNLIIYSLSLGPDLILIGFGGIIYTVVSCYLCAKKYTHYCRNNDQPSKS